MSVSPRTITILISNWPQTQKFSQFFKNTGREDLFLPWSRVGHALRPIFMLWLVKIWQVSSCGKFMQHLESCLLWQLKLTEFESTCDVFNCLFPLDVQNEIQLLSKVFSYSWLVCLLGSSLRNASLVKAANPKFGWHRFCFSPCWVRMRIIKAQAILALLNSFQELHLEIW